MARPLILVGGGGHCKSVIEAAESAGFTIKGILDLPVTLGSRILDYEVIGNDNDVQKYVDTCDFVVTVGSIKDSSLRVKLHNLIKQRGGNLATVIASTANVSKHSSVGEGTVVLHNANVNAGSQIGKSVIINSCSNIEHDVEVGDYCHVSTGAMINGNSIIGHECFVGSGSVIANNVSIGNNVIIGAGAVVINDLPDSCTVVGVPAHPLI